MQRAHGITNGCFVVAVNRVGFEKHPDKATGIEFWGQTFVSAPDGCVLGRASVAEEEVFIVELNMDELLEFRLNWPFFRDRRIDAYEDITSQFLSEKSITIKD